MSDTVTWFKVPIIGMPGFPTCSVPVTEDGRMLDADGEPLPIEERGRECGGDTTWTVGTLCLCAEHFPVIAEAMGDNADDILAASGLTTADAPHWFWPPGRNSFERPCFPGRHHARGRRNRVSEANEKRHDELVGARVIDVQRDGGLVYLTLEHKGCDDELCVVLARAPETVWRYAAISIAGADVACPDCDGVGAMAGAHTECVHDCPRCHGTGLADTTEAG